MSKINNSDEIPDEDIDSDTSNKDFNPSQQNDKKKNTNFLKCSFHI